MNTKKVTRFEVIDHTSEMCGRILVKKGVSVDISIQDDGRTMKVFLNDKINNDVNVIIKKAFNFEVYPEDLGYMPWVEANEVCKKLGDGWRLPTIGELNLMTGIIKKGYYWSGLEHDCSYARLFDFSQGFSNSSKKFYSFNVRAVRDNIQRNL